LDGLQPSPFQQGAEGAIDYEGASWLSDGISRDNYSQQVTNIDPSDPLAAAETRAAMGNAVYDHLSPTGQAITLNA
jgi:hypothetical protein